MTPFSFRACHRMPFPILRTLLRTTPTVAPVPHRGVLSLTGSQTTSFLNGVLASSVPEFKPFYSAFLHAQARHFYYLLTEFHMTRIYLTREESFMMYLLTPRQRRMVPVACYWNSTPDLPKPLHSFPCSNVMC